LSYLRFTPAEYRAVARVCRRLDLGSYNPPTFQRVLALALSDASPGLSDRVSRFGRGEVRLLYDHLRAKTRDAQRPFPSEEWRKLGEACESVPATHRFAHQVQRAVIGHLRTASPGLCRKLARMSISQFVRLFDRVRESGRNDER
jgi:hypothetical protein